MRRAEGGPPASGLCRAAAVAVTAAVLAAGCGTVDRVRSIVDSPEQAHIGMLVVVEPDDCMLPEGCGPRSRIYDEEFDRRVVALGDLAAADSGRVVRLEGRWAAPTATGDGERTERVLEVSDYRVLSRYAYHDFLVRQADLFARERFGCPVVWDKAFAWRMRGDVPYLIVRMTDTGTDLDPAPRIELWFDGVTGHRVEADIQPRNADPCAGAGTGPRAG